MDFLRAILIEHSALQAIMVISIISALGIILGRVKFLGISLGVTFIFFAGILAGHLGLNIDPEISNYVESFGLSLFVYALGLQVGPGFFSSLRSGGFKLIAIAIGVVIAGTLSAVGLSLLTSTDMGAMSGILCGATTNTPALGAAQQTLIQLGKDSSSAALSCAITYPFGVVGVILTIALLKRFVIKPNELPQADTIHSKNTFIAEYIVSNPGLFNKTISQIANLQNQKFIISRLWRENEVSIPTSDKAIKEGDRLLVTTSPENVEKLTAFFGDKVQKDWNENEIDWNSVDEQLISQRIVITRPEINGKKLSSLRLRNNYGINISRVYRSGIQLLATPDLTLQMGDRVTVVGEKTAINSVEKILGNAVKSLNEPNLTSVFIGLFIGLLIGSIPIMIPGVSVPIKLGLAGGPIIVGILIGTFGPRIHMITYTTQSANMMIRGLGLSIYLACLGLDAGKHFFETVVRPEGLLWLLLGAAITILPGLIMTIIAVKIAKLDFGSAAGLLCGSMANPMALNYTNENLDSDKPTVAYATVYPICMFLRIIIIQLVMMLLI